MAQRLQVKRQGVGWNSQPLRDVTGGKSFGTYLHKKPVDLQTALLCESTQGLDGSHRFHDSRIVELRNGVKPVYAVTGIV